MSTINNQLTDKTISSTVIACATVMEEIMPLLPSTVSYQILDFGLHINPGDLKTSLQKAINVVSDRVKNIILGYGLCSQAVVGLKSRKSRLIIPRIDDCIALFLGSQGIYQREQKSVPGTYYLTKGWLKTASTPFDEYEGMVKKFGKDKARKIMGQILKNYTRLAFINTGTSDLELYHQKAKDIALRFGLEYVEIAGYDDLVKKLIFGPWDDSFIIVNPGDAVTFNHFRPVSPPIKPC
jgi:hypothetical protein